MASTGVNVFRWGALVVGVFYGISHQSAITARDRAAHAKHEYEHKQKLIGDAKAEYKRKTSPQTDNVIRDASHPDFDLEKYLTAVQKENP
ncbi:hypothetical protein AMS68_003692 [Peltaster fructicola]|uniref:ATP synthase F(0) complex subunit e, mitochondrial n=1 Tax=Peltaster fructicola TaxID=286661 RepID=A0A6H0XU52_9PEZI|nr:hypothetical protein AMS68_003692 [Peltaster fructicola]